MELNARDKAVHDERARIYGDATDGHTNLGLIFTALIQGHYDIKLPHPVPADLALLMMAGGKLNRASRANVYHADNYVDGKVYFALADDAKKRTEAKKEEPFGKIAAFKTQFEEALDNVQVVFGGEDWKDAKVRAQAVDYFKAVLEQQSGKLPEPDTKSPTLPNPLYVPRRCLNCEGYGRVFKSSVEPSTKCLTCDGKGLI